MAPAMEYAQPPSMSRSNSTPELASLSSYRYGNGQQGTQKKSNTGFDLPSFDSDFDLDTTFRNNGPAKSFPVSQTAEWRPFEQKVALEQPPSQPTRRRTGSLIDRPRLWFPGSKSSKDASQMRPHTPNEDTMNNTKSSSSGRTKTKSDAFSSFTKRSWLSSSSSSSPSPSNATPQKDPSSKLVGSRRPELIADPQATLNRWSEPTRSAPKSFTRATSYFSKMKQKQPLLEKPTNGPESDTSSAASDSPPTASTQAVFSPQSTPYDNNDTPTTEDSFSELSAQMQDPLWPAFKSIEMEFKVFISKTTSQQVVMVGTTVLPFLRNTANHWSTKKLRPEDLDRRTQVLNTWWMEILDMLDGTTVPGVDRPALYDALTTIMMRSEWRLTTAHFLSSADRTLRETVRSNSWGKGLGPWASLDKPKTLIDAAEHNVRSTFVSNLVKQVVFAVEKMSLRYAPLPLVTFAGKTCAYAFFFIPGFATVLARQWGISQHQLKRTADVLGIPPLIKGWSDDKFASFPPELRSLSWSSPRTMFNMLRREPDVPATMPSLSWSGHWKPRWKGLDTDLFYVFSKYFHILSNDFLPSEMTLEEKAQSPAFILVQAQLLVNLDKTLHRQSAEAAAANAPPLAMNGLSPMDETAMAMPLPASEFGEMTRGMSECKLVVLLRGFLFDSSPDQDNAKQTFAASFARLMAGAVRKTSLFDSHACFALCDFLEEALTTYDDFVGPDQPNQYIDWTFWLDVFKKMLLSHNTVTEVRVLCFIFAMWDILTRDSKQKEALCVEWLLTEEVFDAFYNHWCPLVRGYYHRLLCWRICRSDGTADEADTNIFVIVASRLKTTWSHYLYVKQTAEDAGRFPPSTAPMLPTPGKKFMIIRQEIFQPPSRSFTSPEPMSRASGAEIVYADDLDVAMPNRNDKKKKSLLGKVIAFTAGVGNVPVPGAEDLPALRAPVRTASWDDEFINARRETAEARTRSPPMASSSTFGTLNRSDSVVSPAIPEEPSNPFKFILAFSEPASPPPDRVLTVPRLPGSAQGILRLQDRCPPVPSSSTAMAPPSYPPPPPPKSLARSATGLDSAQEPHRTVTASPTWPLESNTTGMDATRKSKDSNPSTTDSPNGPMERAGEQSGEPTVQPSKPQGIFARSAVYAGRSMAEWAQVVAECNNFAERRRREGVVFLKDVEVPALSVDGFQGMSG